MGKFFFFGAYALLASSFLLLPTDNWLCAVCVIFEVGDVATKDDVKEFGAYDQIAGDMENNQECFVKRNCRHM